MGGAGRVVAGAVALLLAGVSAGLAGSPLPAAGVFVSRNYAFTFRAPAGLSYCRLAEDWTGSDHGTILFLTPPAFCGGAGYPSISRGFTPEGTPRIEVYYGRTNGDLPSRRGCRRVGRVRFLGRAGSLCAVGAGPLVGREVRGEYVADSDTEAVVTLVTSGRRLAGDMAVFRALVASAHPCTIPWQDAEGRGRVMGTGVACPEEGDFY